MKLLIILFGLLLLSGCSNTEQVFYDNVTAVFLISRDPETTAITKNILIGNGNHPYRASQEIKLHHKDGFVVDLSDENVLSLFDGIVFDVEGRPGPGVYPHRSFFYWEEGVSKIKISQKPGSYMNIYKKNESLVAVQILSSSPFSGIEVKGKKKDFPLSKVDLEELFGPPTKVLTYFSE